MKKHNDDILRKAIQNLPAYTCNSQNIWENINQILDKNRENEKPDLNNILPEYKAPEQIWENIEHTLNSMQLQKSIDELPTYQLKKNIWGNIENKLDKTNRIFSINSFSRTIRVAASIVLFAGMSAILVELFYHNKSKDTISYSVETMDMPMENVNDVIKENSDNGNIKTLCQNNPEICTSPVFVELQKQVEDINLELDKITNILKENNDPQMQRYFYRLENERTDIERKMLNIINQS